MATIAGLLEVKQADVEWDAWFTDKMSITHLALLEDHLLDYSQRSADDQCKNCMLWHCEKLKGYSIYEAPKFFDGDHESTYQKAGKLAQAVQDSLGNLAQPEALDYAKKVRDLRYELIGYGVYDFTVAQGQDRHFEELERYIREAEMEELGPCKELSRMLQETPLGAESMLAWASRLKYQADRAEGCRSLQKAAYEEAARIKLAVSPMIKPVKMREAEMANELYRPAVFQKRMFGDEVYIFYKHAANDKQAFKAITELYQNWNLLAVASADNDIWVLEKDAPLIIDPEFLREHGVKMEQESLKTIQQLLQEQELLEQHQKDRPQDIIFFKDTIMKHYFSKEDFYPDSFRVVKPEPGVMVTLGCLKKNKWYPERLECVPTQDIHRTIVPRTEKYIKEAEEWEAIGVPTQHRETEVGIVPRELAEVISANMEVCLARNGRKPESMSVADIQSELNALLYDEAVRKACDAKDRELLSIVIAQGKAGHFDFLTGKTEWKVRGKWRRPENDFDIEENVQLDVEFRDATDECVGERIIELLKSYNKKAIGEELLYARTIPIEEGTL